MSTLKAIGDDGVCFEMNRILNRYHSIDEDDNLKKSILENYLWFSDPSDFNDPYDCNMECGVDCSEKEIYEFFIDMNLKQNLGFTERWMGNRTKQLFNNPSEAHRFAKDGDLKTISQLGVCCFSQKDDALLMWSHYADKHKGICLSFDVSKDKSVFGGQIFQVEYPEKYPIYNYPCDQGKFSSYRFLIATKSKDWEYENEVRLVRDYSKDIIFRGPIKFNKKALVAIKFGYKCKPDDEDIKEMNKWLIESGGYEHVRFYKAKLKKLQFGLEFDEISRIMFN